MRIVSIVGARPQFIKLAPIAWQAKGICEHLIVHTGQHYDALLTDIFFSELNIPNPSEVVVSGSGTHSEQTARILIGVEQALEKLKPDKVIVYGDTNSTLAGALCASKMKIRVSHIEAGLRSFNKRMPEEINRIITDHVSDLLFAPTVSAMKNLDREGLSSKSILVGDLMLELLKNFQSKLEDFGTNKEIERIFCTIHRAENTDSPMRLSEIINKLSESELPVDLFAHPRLLSKSKQFGIELSKGQINVKEPLSYFEAIKLVNNYVGVITDSGGLQKEAYFLSTPCLTVRNETEWPETLEHNWNRLDPNLSYALGKWWSLPEVKPVLSAYGDGNSSIKILEALINN
jgi:UDP-N-acetylglucosamine 2-epimerase (non-hydrolysing)